jgi:DNA-binding beta-propeller fold protein YncE
MVMKVAVGLCLGLAVTTLGTSIGCGDAPQGVGPDAGTDPGAPCEGMCIGKLVLGPEMYFFDMSVDRDRGHLYGNGFRLDVSNPRAMKATALLGKGPIVVDPSTGRYATSGSPGTANDTLAIFNPDDTLYDSKPLPGVPFAMDVDPANGLFFVTTRTEDEIVVHDQTSRTVLASRPVGASPLRPLFDPTSGNVFVNLFLGSASDRYNQWLILDRNHELGASGDGIILAADGVRNLVYLAVRPDGGSSYNRLEVRESATWAVASTQIDTDAYWLAPDPASNRLYVMRSLNELAVFDQTAGAYLTSFPLGNDFLIGNVAFAPGDDRIYVVGDEPLADATYQKVLLVFATR